MQIDAHIHLRGEEYPFVHTVVRERNLRLLINGRSPVKFPLPQ